MTVAELKKELEKFNDNDVIIMKNSYTDYDGHTKTDYFEMASFFNRTSKYKVVSKEKAKKLLDN